MKRIRVNPSISERCCCGCCCWYWHVHLHPLPVAVYALPSSRPTNSINFSARMRAEWVSIEFYVPLDTIIGHYFDDESLQAITYGTTIQMMTQRVHADITSIYTLTFQLKQNCKHLPTAQTNAIGIRWRYFATAAACISPLAGLLILIANQWKCEKISTGNYLYSR